MHSVKSAIRTVISARGKIEQGTGGWGGDWPGEGGDARVRVAAFGLLLLLH